MKTGLRFLGAWIAAAAVLAVLGQSVAAAQDEAPAPVPDTGEAALSHLPLIEVPATAAAGDTFVVLYSGDAGWAGTAQGFSAGLAGAGEPVVGIDSLRYFFLRPRAPHDAAADLAAVIEHYAAVWSRPKVILVGYSFGADSLPLIVEQLSPEERARVRVMVLISPTDRADMVFDGLSLINLTLPGARRLAPALLTLGAIPAICIKAKYDPRAACDRFPQQAITSVHLPGFHRYHGQYQAVTRIILAAAGLAAPDPEAPPSLAPDPISR